MRFLPPTGADAAGRVAIGTGRGCGASRSDDDSWAFGAREEALRLIEVVLFALAGFAVSFKAP